MTDAAKSFLFVFGSSPQAGTAARDGIDCLLAYAAFDQRVAVVFYGDGVWQLHPRQQPELAGKKSVYKSLAALPMYDINQIFVHTGSVVARGLANMELPFVEARQVDDQQMNALIRQYSQIFRF